MNERYYMTNTRFHLALLIAIMFACGLILAACAPAVPPLDDSLVKPYSGELDRQQQTAQAVALNYEELKTAVVDPVSGETLRSEVFGVYPARPSDLIPGQHCLRGK